ncbi:MAG: hypothetical protein SNJ59_00250 [Aggregatilineales bacterium]
MRTILIILLAAVLSMLGTTAQGEVIPSLSGQIAYIGADYNVYVLDLATNTTRALTENAGAEANSVRFYQWPTWATDGRLAFFATLARGRTDFTTEVYITDGEDAPTLAYTGEVESFNYAYWAPRDCAPGCRELAVLLSSEAAGGFFIELIRSSAGDANGLTRTLGAGSPFYYSWSPDGTRMVWQRFGRQIDIFNVDSESIEQVLDVRLGQFFAPAWSPVDDRILIGIANPESSRSQTRLAIVTNDSVQPITPPLEGNVAFSWSPDGNLIAYISSGDPLMVIDSVSGEIIASTPLGGVLAFFWSPDSANIAYVTLATPPGTFSAKSAQNSVSQLELAQASRGLAWSVLDVTTGAVERYASFIPTQEMTYLLTYFDQFAQSHRIWSPDSRHLLYSELTSDGLPVINLLDISTAFSVPLSIAQGLVGIWSFD